MKFKTLFLIGALEFAYLVAIVLKLTGLIGLSWYWITSPVWFPIVGFLLYVFHLLMYDLSVSAFRMFIRRLKS